MSREIKFRAWDKKLKELVVVVNIDYIKSTISVKNEKREFWTVDQTELVLMQYTGLKDKNGKDIYDGDIVITADDIGSIVYQDASFEINWKPPVTWRMHTRLRLMYEDVEVIGNIYENPEMLEDQQ